MAATNGNRQQLVSRQQAHGLTKRLRDALSPERSRAAFQVISDSLPPADIAVLETFAGLVKERAKQWP